MNIIYFGGCTWNLFHEMTGSAGSLYICMFYVFPACYTLVSSNDFGTQIFYHI